MKLAVLGCSAITTGELTVALEFARRLRRDVALHALVGTPALAAARAHGATVHPWPTVGARGAAFQRIANTLQDLRPDVLLVADLFLLHGLSPELGSSLLPLLEHAMRRMPVVALDYYDFRRHRGHLDLLGERVVLPTMSSLPGVVLPSPLVPPEGNTPGRGRFLMMDDVGPLSAERRREIRGGLGLGAKEKVIILTTSRWQHEVPRIPAARPMAEHIPGWLLRCLDVAARAAGGVTLLHVSPVPLDAPALDSLRYRHMPSLPRDRFVDVMSSVDLALSLNTPASSNIRAMTLRVPVLCAHLPDTPTLPTVSDVSLARERDVLLGQLGKPHAWSLWPAGFYTFVQEVLRDNPFSSVHRYVNVLDADALIAEATRLLTNADDVRHAQERYLRTAASTVGTPDEALDAALNISAK
ncbi:MAG: DUF6365 family protein [Myxococcota bacterium]